MEKKEADQKERKHFVMEIRCPVVLFCMGQMFIKIVCEKNLNNLKES